MTTYKQMSYQPAHILSPDETSPSFLHLEQIHCELGNKWIFHFRAVKHDNFVCAKTEREGVVPFHTHDNEAVRHVTCLLICGLQSSRLPMTPGGTIHAKHGARHRKDISALMR